MTSRELVIKTLNHQPVPRVPRDLWIPTESDAPRPDDLAEMNVRYPSDIISPENASPFGKRLQGKSGKAGEITDAWGCVWATGQEGDLPKLKHSPLSDASKISSYQPPAELLDKGRFTKASKICSTTDRFVLAWSEVRPFDRVRQLRGGAALNDLGRGTKDIRALLAMLHDVACKELEHWAATDVDGVVFRDDWGTPEGLLVSPEVWRDLFRPMVRDYCQILHSRDKFVFFSSSGDISDIFGDLVKLEIDAIHSELRLMNAERLAKRYCGRVTFWGEMDSERLRNPGSPSEFREAVWAIRKAFDANQGGVIAQCAWDSGVRLQTIAALFEQWLAPMKQ
jgi:uroporphyrinogen decarboxylase